MLLVLIYMAIGLAVTIHEYTRPIMDRSPYTMDHSTRKILLMIACWPLFFVVRVHCYLDDRHNESAMAHFDAMAARLEKNGCAAALEEEAAADKTLRPLVGPALLLVQLYSEIWTSHNGHEFSVPAAKITDIAFRSAICHLAAFLTAEPTMTESLTLPAASRFIHTFWTTHPGASNPMTPEEISAMILASSILLKQDPSASPPPLFKLGLLVMEDWVLASSFPAAPARFKLGQLVTAGMAADVFAATYAGLFIPAMINAQLEHIHPRIHVHDKDIAGRPPKSMGQGLETNHPEAVQSWVIPG